MNDRHASRRSAVAEQLAGLGAAALLVTDLRNVAYLTGFHGSAGVVLLYADGEAVLCTDSRYELQVAEQAPGVAHVITREYVADALRHGHAPVAPLAVQADHLTLAAATRVRDALAGSDAAVGLVESRGLVEEVRRHKDEVELRSIARACTVVDEAWTALLDRRLLGAGRTEREVAAELEHAMRRAGSEGVSFDTIVASGPNGALPHHVPSDRELTDGDLVVVDFGALVDGYASDCTRTVAVGEVSGTLREIYEVTLRAQLAGVGAVRPGIGCAELDAVSRSVIADAGYGEYFGHSLGHGVGLDVHEAPSVASKATGTLAVGDVVTVEPGIYLPGRGGVRIEDTVAVLPDGHRVLTTTSKQLVVL